MKILIDNNGFLWDLKIIRAAVAILHVEVPEGRSIFLDPTISPLNFTTG